LIKEIIKSLSLFSQIGKHYPKIFPNFGEKKKESQESFDDLF